jgi:hypothetical protein
MLGHVEHVAPASLLREPSDGIGRSRQSRVYTGTATLSIPEVPKVGRWIGKPFWARHGFAGGPGNRSPEPIRTPPAGAVGVALSLRFRHHRSSRASGTNKRVLQQRTS